MWKTANLMAPAILCLTGGAAVAGESIGYSVSPCYGTCPVYKVVVAADGRVTFEGQQHTALQGVRERQAGGEAYRRASRALASYRPAPGRTTRTQCERQVSDQSGYRIVWTGKDSVETVLNHDRGCASPRNAALNRAMDAMPATLGIVDWIKASR